MDFVKKTYEKEEVFKKRGEKKVDKASDERGNEFVFSKDKMNIGFIDYI